MYCVLLYLTITTADYFGPHTLYSIIFIPASNCSSILMHSSQHLCNKVLIDVQLMINISQKYTEI